ncbi:NACHT, LRR and PYD domains-containing protein 3-like isoform X1 [Xenopus laevis]|uniref:NACHT, LRR and PYD domains-containing protein 3-like isoform X1 n=2 Tax=Xenopus laevis TaxID=8355 RepID=A0A8J1LJA0_XENLA|nr:NACHT, LRR and PYD domains-containing protein 3-like isoform X1 [Xenopus laevis]XP_041429601.1 NACHT, LRR and PYD domains-containing protein 3-like isoform X1 [Xenopus laevis]XP_041429602.1 NACHT, LRR and PYD domains-containing protein 3-like isoform X1 [Xenopus laevis]
MEELRGKVVTNDELQQFRQKLAQYEEHQLNIFYEYFWEDLIYILETLDSLSILRELSFRHCNSVEHYVSIRKQRGASAFARMLLEDIRASGRDTTLGLWESLFALQNDHPHPNLLGILDELTQTGDFLEQNVILDIIGPDLSHDLKACRLQHKQTLLEKTQNLVEHRAPGLTTESLSFHISERYLDLIVVSSQHFRSRPQHELIATGGIHEHYLQRAQSNLERISPNRLFRWCHRKRRVPQTVLVSGVPGVGKTTLMQKFVYDWANGKLYQRFAFVFFFKFRDLNNDELSLAQMIIDEYPYLHNQLDIIFQNPAQLLFIFDGLDESKYQIDLKQMELCTNPCSMQTVGVIVSSLVRQTLLNGCSVLITSRPTRLATVETSIFHRVSEIMGFFPKEREKYFLHFFRDYTMAEKAFHYVRENGMLYTFCYIPSYCWIICTVLSMCFRDQKINSASTIEFFPKTVTQLFASFLSNILANHSQQRCIDKNFLISIGRMAENGVNSHTLSFTKDDLEAFSVDTSSHLVTSFVMESGKPPHVSYSFLHLTIQEFMAALVHYLDYSPERLQKALEEAKSYKDGRGEIFLRFISGLSDSSTRSLLKPYIGDLSAEASKHVISFLQMSIPTRRTQNTDIRKVLNEFARLTESRNKALVFSSIGSNKHFDFSEFYLAPLDCTVLAFILESCRQTEVLNLGACFIQTEGLERLVPTLHTVTDVRFTKNNLRNEDVQQIYSLLSHPYCRIQKLSLRNNGLTEESCANLATAINENKSLRELDLSKNKLAGDDFCQLLAVLSVPTCRIERLGLQEIKLTPEYAKSLLSLSVNTNLTHLNISSNFFGDAGYPHIKELILSHPSLKEIRVELNDFSEETEEDLKQLQTRRPDVVIS